MEESCCEIFLAIASSKTDSCNESFSDSKVNILRRSGVTLLHVSANCHCCHYGKRLQFLCTHTLLWRKPLNDFQSTNPVWFDVEPQDGLGKSPDSHARVGSQEAPA
ncbi:hypothetical protein CEXT_161091 [Caerostris extrusa]|uniref:Uncharacterized protein n=1 Tax=Caerostris extrusa TaxID=172846 RepID=A0AAV4W9Y7_CAEEX|nr:hypothetical protein CEXT_161091 [Caerostris extrusa]